VSLRREQAGLEMEEQDLHVSTSPAELAISTASVSASLPSRRALVFQF